MHFGFSYMGLIFLLMLMTPNLLWTRNKPTDYEKYVGNEKKMLVILERAGEAAVIVLGIGHIGIHMQHRREAFR